MDDADHHNALEEHGAGEVNCALENSHLSSKDHGGEEVNVHVHSNSSVDHGERRVLSHNHNGSQDSGKNLIYYY